MRQLRIKPLKRLSDPQRQLLEDASKSKALQKTRFGWRVAPDAKTHTAHTAQSLLLRGYLAEEYGLLFATPKGRALIDAEAANAAA